jgi:polar amino acid transport system substrate-binding protein
MYKFYLFLCLLLCITPSVSAEGAFPDILLVCDDELETPPFTYVDPQNQSALTGYSVAVIREIAARADKRLDITLLPWARCQNEVKLGRRHIALNATWNEQRAESFLFSDSFHEAQDFYYYDSRRYPVGLDIKSPKDLQKYKICGLPGYNYQHLTLTEKQIDFEARDHQQVMLKLSFGQCDLFIEKFPIMAGFSLIGRPYIRNFSLGYSAVPTVPPTPFYMLIEPGEAGQAIKQFLDAGLAQLKADGSLKRLYDRFVPPP